MISVRAWELSAAAATGAVIGFVCWSFPGWAPIMEGKGLLDLATAVGTVGTTVIAGGSASIGWWRRRKEVQSRAWFVLTELQPKLGPVPSAIKRLRWAMLADDRNERAVHMARSALEDLGAIDLSISEASYLALTAVDRAAVTNLRMLGVIQTDLLKWVPSYIPPPEHAAFVLKEPLKRFFDKQCEQALSSVDRLHKLHDELSAALS